MPAENADLYRQPKNSPVQEPSIPVTKNPSPSPVDWLALHPK